PPLVPQPAPAVGEGERIVIRLASGSHYLQRVYADQPGAAVTALEAREYATLYAVPAEKGPPRSLFGPDGLVTGSEAGRVGDRQRTGRTLAAVANGGAFARRHARARSPRDCLCGPAAF
ncbi:MAG: hypothetical protein MUC53_07005, partial [Candidatus Contendobacter sp.]|nr:hypothetical protein [Candidatus Contendobacter sp.]